MPQSILGFTSIKSLLSDIILLEYFCEMFLAVCSKCAALCKLEESMIHPLMDSKKDMFTSVTSQVLPLVVYGIMLTKLQNFWQVYDENFMVGIDFDWGTSS